MNYETIVRDLLIEWVFLNPCLYFIYIFIASKISASVHVKKIFRYWLCDWCFSFLVLDTCNLKLLVKPFKFWHIYLSLFQASFVTPLGRALKSQLFHKLLSLYHSISISKSQQCTCENIIISSYTSICLEFSYQHQTMLLFPT